MVEIIPKKPQKPLPWKNFSFYISAALLLVVILSYVVLTYLEAKSSSSLEELKGQIARLGTPEDRQLETKVFNYERNLKDFSTIFNGRRLLTNFFDGFEKLVHPKVWFSDFALDPTKMEATLFGRTASFQTLGQQLDILKNQKVVKEVNLVKLSIGEEGDTEFTIYLSFNSEMFTP